MKIQPEIEICTQFEHYHRFPLIQILPRTNAIKTTHLQYPRFKKSDKQQNPNPEIKNEIALTFSLSPSASMHHLNQRNAVKIMQ